VAWGEPFCPGLPGEPTRLSRGEVTPFEGNIGVLACESGLDEKMVGVGCECDDFADVCWGKSSVGHVGDPLARRDLEGVLLQEAERNGSLCTSGNRRVVVFAPSYRAFGHVEPRPDLQAQTRETLGPHIDADRLLQRESKAGNAVI